MRHRQGPRNPFRRAGKLIDYLGCAPEGEAVCADDAMAVRWCGPDDLDDIQPTATLWPRLEKLFNRSDAHRYQQDYQRG